MIPTVRVVHVCPPIIVQTDLSNFQAVVQELTGKRKSSSMHNNMCCHECHNSNIVILESTIEAINDCNKDGCMNECNNECINDEIRCIKEGFIMVNDESLSPNWSTSSSSDHSISQEVSSSLIMACSNEDCTLIDHNQSNNEDNLRLIQSNTRYIAVTDADECASPALSHPCGSKKAKVTKACVNQDFPFDQALVSNNQVLLSNIEQILFHEESTLGFISPPLSLSLDDDEQLLADEHFLQDLYEMEIFPFSS